MYSFSTSDYLAIRTDPEILQLTFDSEKPIDYYQVFERKISQFFGTEMTLFFPDSYLALVALLRNLIQTNDRIFIPEETDGSIPDALEIIQRRHETVTVGTINEHCLESLPQTVSRVVFLANGICEMNGSIAPVDLWKKRLEQFSAQTGIPALIILDDSLGVGLLGPNYRGTFDYYGITANQYFEPNETVPCFSCGSLTEALGSSGGFLTGNRKWLRNLKKSEPCCCSRNQMPLSTVVASTKALELAMRSQRHEALERNRRILVEKLNHSGLNFSSNSNLPFVLLKVPNAKETVNGMRIRGYQIGITHFTRKPQITLAVNSNHKEAEIEFLVHALICQLEHEKKKEKKNSGYRKNSTKAEQENNVIQKENIS